MLVLSRKTDEEIVIGEDIIIKIISIQNGIVKIGFDAPQDKIILRGELRAAVTGENLKASQDSTLNVKKLGEILSKK